MVKLPGLSKFQFHRSGELSVSKQKYIAIATHCYHVYSLKQVNIFNLSFISIFLRSTYLASLFSRQLSRWSQCKDEEDKMNGMNKNMSLDNIWYIGELYQVC